MSIRKVLVVDDDADVRTIASLSLRRVGGWEVEAAASGGEALLKAAETPFDLILLDIMMPELDGPQTFTRLRQGPAPETPVIFLTGKVQKAEVSRVLALGASGFIPKPFDPMRLAAEIRRILGE